MLFAVRSFSLSALLKNFAGIGFLSLFLSVIEPISFGITDPFLSAVFGGVMSGIGIGLTLLHNGSTGGSDFAAMLLHRFFPRISLSAFVIGIDSAVILGSSAVFQDRNLLLYSLISLYLSGRVMDFVLVRGDFAKSVIIVSRKNSEIAQEIMAVLERGVTGLESYGFYDSKKAMALLCVVKKRQIPHLLEIVKTFDSGAFTVVMDARSVHGLGFDEK